LRSQHFSAAEEISSTQWNTLAVYCFDMPNTGPYREPNKCSTYHLIALL